MLPVPTAIAQHYDGALERVRVAWKYRPHYRRWLRFYLDFCFKYGLAPMLEGSFTGFDEKLREKGQPDWARRQAWDAVVLFWALDSGPEGRGGSLARGTSHSMGSGPEACDAGAVSAQKRVGTGTSTESTSDTHALDRGKRAQPREGRAAAWRVMHVERVRGDAGTGQPIRRGPGNGNDGPPIEKPGRSRPDAANVDDQGERRSRCRERGQGIGGSQAPSAGTLDLVRIGRLRDRIIE